MNFKKLIWASVVIGVLILLAACRPTGSTDEISAPTPSAQGNTGIYQTLSIDAFADILANNLDDYTIINVHIPYEGEIEGTDANISYDDIEALTAALPDKGAPIILYCRSGNMSEQASQALLELGYTQVWDVPGGMNAWQDSGRALIND